MKLVYAGSSEEFEAEILEVEELDYIWIRNSKQFLFDWQGEKNNHVFKIVKVDDEATPEIMGLISITNIPAELRIHINLVENANDNKGKHKKVDRIAGCLIAFAVKVSFEKGYMGFTSLAPKTALIGLYVKKYGFSQYGRQLAIEGRPAIELIRKYL